MGLGQATSDSQGGFIYFYLIKFNTDFLARGHLIKFRQVPSNVLHHKNAPIFTVLPPVKVRLQRNGCKSSRNELLRKSLIKSFTAGVPD